MIWQDLENITTLVEYLQKDPGFSDRWYNLKISKIRLKHILMELVWILA